MKALARTSPEAAEPAGFLNWWLSELQDLLPRSRAPRGRRRPALRLLVERPFVRVLGRRGQRFEPLGTFLLPDESDQPADGHQWCAPELRRTLERHKDATVLVLGPDDAVSCTDLLPASAESELGRIVSHKLDLLTPWPADQVYAAHRVTARRPDGMLEVLLAVAPRATVDELRRRLARVGLTPSAVDVAGEDGTRTAEVDLLRGETQERGGGALARVLLALLIAALAVGAGLAGWQIWQRQQRLAEQRQLIASLEERLADLPALRERITNLQAEAGFLANERRSRPSPLIVLEVLSRLLPDSVWLTDVRLSGRELVIAGMADDSSALIPLIEGAPELARARFQTPSTRVRVRTSEGGEREVERFAISAEVDPAVEPSL